MVDALVIPRRGRVTLCRVDVHGLTDLAPVEGSPPLTRQATSPDGWIAYVEAGERSVGVIHVPSGIASRRSLPMPEKMYALSLAFSGSVLYVGGAFRFANEGGIESVMERLEAGAIDLTVPPSGIQMLGFVDLAATDLAWTPMDVPERVRQPGKAIDDLVLDGAQLVAVDDVVTPKYLLFYDVADPRRPRFVREIDLSSGFVFEHLERACVGDDALAILSYGMHGAVYVRVYERGTVVPRGVIVAQQRRAWTDIAWLGRRLFVAAEEDGLGYIDVPAQPATTGGSAARFGDFQYMPVLAGAKAKRVFAIPSVGAVVIVVETAGGMLDTVIWTAGGA